MIRIDLLPPEYRKADRTPPGIFLGTIGFVVLFMSAAACTAYFWFSVVGGARSDVASAQDLLESKRPQAQYCDALETEKKEYVARFEHVKNFSDSRILWTKKLDQLASIVDAPAEADRHLVWFDSLSVKMNDARSRGLHMKGKSATGQLKKLSDFNSDLKTQPFFKEFVDISVPAGKVVVDDEFDPPAAWEFEASLQIEGAVDDKKATKKK